MRALDFLLAVVVLAVVLFLLYAWVRRGDGTPAAPRWQADTELSAGHTVVLIRRLSGETELSRQIVASIPDRAPDWDARYHEAMAEARSRAAALESESG
jgi:hypothetical protein